MTILGGLSEVLDHPIKDEAGKCGLEIENTRKK